MSTPTGGDIQLETRFEAKTPILTDNDDNGASSAVDISPSLVPILPQRIPSTEPLASGLGNGSSSSPTHATSGGNGYGSVGASPHSSSHYTIPAHTVAAKRRIKIRQGQHQLYDDDISYYMANRKCLDRCSSTTDPDALRVRLSRTNAIKSTKYEWYSFLPLNLFEQLAPWSKPANFYFLCIACLQAIKEISTTQGRPSILVPLCFVLAVTALKDAFEDNNRRKQDRVKNEAVYDVYRGGTWTVVASKDLLVGDIIKIVDGQRIPSDIVLIGSGIDNGTHAWVDTKDLDGETNLKPKSVPLNILKTLRYNWEGVDTLNFDLRGDAPSGDMSEWNGDITATSNGANDQINITLDHLILSECVVRNTPWILGLVSYTGDDSKIRKNMESQMRNQRFKTTGVFRLTKKLFGVMAFLQLVLCILCGGIGSANAQSDVQNDAWYLSFSDSPERSGFLRVWTWFIMAKDFLPIALYVSLEMVQFFQAMFMAWDLEMTVVIDDKLHSCRAQTSRLNEELSQVHYVFSDKTGTLTQNSMDFRKAIIGARQYGTGTTEAGVVRRVKIDGGDIVEALDAFAKQRRDDAIGTRPHPHVEFNGETKLRGTLSHVLGPLSDLPPVTDTTSDDVRHGRQARDFLYCMSLNNSVFPKVKRGVDHSLLTTSERKRETRRDNYNLTDVNNSAVMQMDSSSPDEKALAYWAQYMGYELYQRAGGKIRLRIREGGVARFEDFEDVCLIDFSSKRKRMTVILQPLNSDGVAFGPLKVFCKGADSFVFKLLKGCASLDTPSADDDEDTKMTAEQKSSLQNMRERAQPDWNYTFNLLCEYGGESLRTLVVASSEKDRSWWFDPERGLKAKYERAQRSQGINEKGHVDGACSNTCGMCAIEREIEVSAEMNLLGATAIEDKLQDGVPHALKQLLEAGIKVWVLTGDNVATAINIGISCNLLEADMENEGRLFKFDKEVANPDAIRRTIDDAERHIIRVLQDEKLSPIFGIALHGDVWKTLLANAQLKKPFFDLASKCRSVVACRLEPKEKADIVAMVKAIEQVTCLAIGDGNNDTPMIKTADIGVGIRGVEGTSAVAASDYAISQFRFLTRLLFVYGRLNYRRVTNLILYIFYKACILVWTLFFFGFFSMWSGQFLYLDWAYQLHNVVFTALPIVVGAVLDRDLEPSTLMKYPFIYSFTRGPVLFNWTIFFTWMVTAFVHAAIAFFIPWLSFGVTSPSSIGQMFGVWTDGLVVYTSVVLITNIRLMTVFGSWSWLPLVAWFGSIIFFFLCMFLFSSSPVWALGGVDYYQALFRLVATARFWFTLFMTVTTAFAFDLLVAAVAKVFFPSPMQVYIEAERLKVNMDALPTPPAEVLNALNPSASHRAWQSTVAAHRQSQPLSSHAYTGSNFSHTASVREHTASQSGV